MYNNNNNNNNEQLMNEADWLMKTIENEAVGRGG